VCAHHFKNGQSRVEDTTKYKDSLVQIHTACPEQFKKSVKFPEKMTEHSAMHFFIENIDWPDNFDKMKIISLPSEMKQLPEGRIVKPNTNDELLHLKNYLDKNNEPIRNIAIFSHAPFTSMAFG